MISAMSIGCTTSSETKTSSDKSEDKTLEESGYF
jgi:hypothetical protein